MKNLKTLTQNEYLWFLITLVLGILLRLYRLSDIPPGFTGDEAWLGLDGQEIAKKGWIGIYIPGHAFGYNALHAYLAGILIKILGSSIISVRLAAVLPGIFGLISFYFLSRKFYSPAVSLFLLSLLSVSHWHIHFSRLAFPGIILVPLFSSLTFLFIFKAIKQKKILNFILAGIFLGLGINSYFFFASALATTFLFLIIMLFSQKKLFKPLVVLSLATILVTIPLGLFVLKNPSVIGNKWQFRSIFSHQNKARLAIEEGKTNLNHLEIVTIQTRRTLKGLFLDGDTDALNGPPGIPLLESPLALLFIMGTLLVLFKLKEEKNFLLLAWLVLSLMIGVVTESAPNAKRILDASLPIFLLMGLSFSYLQKRLKTTPFLLLGLAIFGFSLTKNLEIYFQNYPQNQAAQKRFAYEIVKMCEFFNQKEAAPYIYFYHPGTYFNYETRRFLCGHLAGEDRSEKYGQFSIENQRKEPVAFVYFDLYQKILPELIKKYPQGELQEFNDENGNLIWGAYLIK